MYYGVVAVLMGIESGGFAGNVNKNITTKKVREGVGMLRVQVFDRWTFMIDARRLRK